MGILRKNRTLRKEVLKVRMNYQNLEDLVLENKEELLADKQRVKQIEMRLEKVQVDLVRQKRREIR